MLQPKTIDLDNPRLGLPSPAIEVRNGLWFPRKSSCAAPSSALSPALVLRCLLPVPSTLLDGLGGILPRCGFSMAFTH